MPETPPPFVVAGADSVGLAKGHTARTEANSRLTAIAGVVLIVVLAAEGVTILRIHRLVAAHVVVG
ncbi:MAG TPA: hypothetical protein VKQ71_17295, partial [Acidimicrobiales bacterium]|nr:hypothetical protein [Acidimicrobiales bacterium]